MTTHKWVWPSVAGVVALALAAPAVRAQSDSRDQHAFATVLDKKGAPVTGLGAADFTVTEDGVKREILHVGPSTEPMQIALLLDTSSVINSSATRDLRTGAAAFVNQIFAASPSSQMALYTFGDRPTQVVDFSSTPIPLVRAVDTLFKVPGSGAYFNDSFRELSQAFAKLKATRPVVVAFVNLNSPEFSIADHARVAATLESAHTSLWAITIPATSGADSLPDSQGRLARQEREQIVNDVASQSGGENLQVFVTTALATTFTQVASLLTSEYDITYARPETMIPPKSVVVAVSRPGVKLLAPHWSGK